MTLKTFTDIVGRRYHLAKKKEILLKDYFC